MDLREKGTRVQGGRRAAGRRHLIGLVWPAVALVVALVAPAWGQPTTAPTTATAPDQLSDVERAELATFTKWLRDESRPADDRKQAAILLLNKPWQAAEKVLLEALANKESPGARLAVTEALIAVAPNGAQPSVKFIDPLMAALSDPSEPLRKSAARALAVYRDQPQLIEQLRQLMSDPARPVESRRAAAVALGFMPPSWPTIEALVASLDDKDVTLRTRATDALNQLTAAGLSSPAAWTKWLQENRGRSILDLLNQRNQRLIQDIAELRGQREQLEKRLVVALETIFKATPQPQQADVVLKYLADPLAPVRVLGLRLIDQMVVAQKPTEPIRKAVGDRLADESPQVRAAAVDVLPYLGEPKAAAALLLEKLPAETDLLVRVRMIRALGVQLKAAEAIPTLLAFLAESPDHVLAAESALALGSIAAKGRGLGKEAEPIVPALLERHRRLTGDEPDVRDALYGAMADVADARCASIFLKGLADESASVRLHSARGLGNIGPVAETHRPGPAEIADAIAGRLANEPDWGIREALILALSRQGPGRSQLTAIFERTKPAVEPNEAVRKRAWDLLVELLKVADKTVQLAWADQLQASPDAGALAALVELLRAIETAGAKSDQWTAAELESVTERLGDALMRANRPAEAAQRYEKIYPKLRQAAGERADALAGKHFQALVAAQLPVAAVAVLKDRLAAASPASSSALASELLSKIRSLLESGDPAGVPLAVAWVQEVRRQLPEATKSAAWADSFGKLAEQAQHAMAAQIADQVAKALDQMLGGDAALASAARKRVEQLGRSAMPALLGELERVLEAEQQNEARENAIIGLLAGPPVNAKDWDPAAPADKKKALLAAYRQRLQNGPVGPP